MNAASHIPVLLDEVLAALAIRPGETHIDGTYGAGSYSRAMAASGAMVIAFDRDPDAVAAGKAAGDDSITLVEARYSDMALHVTGPVKGVVLDIGVSSMQLDQATRGFSFQGNGPLDMRMEQAGESAADFVNSADETEIADVIYRFGDEPKSRRIAHSIVAARPLSTTGELARAVRKATGWRDGDKKDPATRTFQAIRIHINRELDELADGLVAAEALLGEGGRLAVVTFHSLEDRMVKRFLRDRSGATPQGSRHAPAGPAARAPTFAAVAKPITAGEIELARNTRARSATLRSAHRTAAPAWGHTGKDAA